MSEWSTLGKTRENSISDPYNLLFRSEREMESCVDFLRNRFLETAADMNVKECESIDNEARLQQHAKTDDDQDLNSLLEVGADVTVNNNDSSTCVAIEERQAIDIEDVRLQNLAETTDNKDLNNIPETGIDVNIKEIKSIDNKDIGLHQCGNELNSLFETRTDVTITDSDINTDSAITGMESVERIEMGSHQLDETGDNEDLDSLRETGTDVKDKETANDEQLIETVNDVNVKGIGIIDNKEQETFGDEQFKKLVETRTGVNGRETIPTESEEIVENNNENLNIRSQTGADVNVRENIKHNNGNIGWTIEEIGTIDSEEVQLDQLPETDDGEQLNRYVKTGADVNVREYEYIHNEEICLHSVVETYDDDDEQFDRISERGGYVNVSEFGSTDSLTGTDEKEELKSLTRAGEETESFNLKEMALHQIVEIGVGEQLKELIPRGVVVNFKDCEGNTALAIAARSGHIDSVNILITAGADIKPDTPINVYTRFCLNTAKSKVSLVSPVADW